MFTPHSQRYCDLHPGLPASYPLTVKEKETIQNTLIGLVIIFLMVAVLSRSSRT